MSSHSSDSARLRGLEVYVDQASLRLYADQALQLVADATAVALYDREGTLLWSSSSDAVHWPAPPAGSPHQRRELGNGRYFYDFTVGKDQLCFSILVIALEPPSLESVFELTQDTVACLERQLQINSSLSAKRRLPLSDQEGLKLVRLLNEAAPSGTLESATREILALLTRSKPGRHAALFMPGKSLLATLPATLEADPKLQANARQLFQALRTQNRIAITDITTSMGRSRALCAPVIGTEDVEGILVLLGEEFVKADARVARAAAGRIGALLRNDAVDDDGILTRDDFLGAIERSLSQHPNMAHSVLYFDADRTHLINDSFGYRAGDEAIATLGRIIAEGAGRAGTVAHLTSDRYALLLKGSAAESAPQWGERILDLIGRESLECNGKSLQLSASVGIAQAPEVAQTSSELLTIAEVAARSAKERGGNQCAVFQDMDASIIQRRSDADQIGHLQMALIENRFLLHAQRIEPLPGVSPANKFEILVRLETEAGKPVPPPKFLSAAERYQLMPALDRWVINKTLESLADSSNTLEVYTSTFAINVSGQSLQEDGFVEHVEQRIAESGVPADALCFEITETAMVRNLPRAQRFISRLQKIGCRIALDDFGTGYSSFAYLKSLPVQYLKIDGVFIRDIMESRLSEAIVRSVVEIGRVMSAATVAEHVESDLVRHRLAELGVGYIQGFSSHQPEPLENVLSQLNAGQIDLGPVFDDLRSA